MKVIQGDLIQLAKDGQFNVIIHGCNCMNTMGAGIAKQIAIHFPTAYKADQETIKGNINKLGSITLGEIQRKDSLEQLIVVNAYTQYDYKGPQPRVSYNAVRLCFKAIAFMFKIAPPGTGREPVKIGYPRIGAGLAGGDWSIISEIIDKELEGFDHTLVEYKP